MGINMKYCEAALEEQLYTALSGSFSPDKFKSRSLTLIGDGAYSCELTSASHDYNVHYYCFTFIKGYERSPVVVEIESIDSSTVEMRCNGKLIGGALTCL